MGRLILILLSAVTCFGQISFSPGASGAAAPGYSLDPSQFSVGSVTNVAVTNGVIVTNLSLKGTAIFNGSSSGAVTVQPAAAAGTWTMTLPTNDGDIGQYLTTDANGITSWSSFAGTSTLNALIAATGNSSINSGAFTNELKWTLTGATQTGLQISEHTAATGGSGAQHLVNIETLAGSTANPLQISALGSPRVTVGNGYIQENGSTFAFIGNTSSGMSAPTTFVRCLWNGSSGEFRLQGASAMSYFTVNNGTDTPLSVTGGSTGLQITEVDTAPIVFDAGVAGSEGISYRNRTVARTSTTSPPSTIASGTTTSSGINYVQNAATSQITFNLPAATEPGVWFSFIVTDADGLYVDANGTDTIQFGTTASGDGIIGSTTIGSSITLVNIASGKWAATEMEGTWAD